MPPDAPTVRVCGTDSQDSGERDSDRHQRRADHAEEVELHEQAVAPVLLQLRAEHPQRKHVEQQMQQPVVQEGVGHQLPELAVNDGVCLEARWL